MPCSGRVELQGGPALAWELPLLWRRAHCALACLLCRTEVDWLIKTKPRLSK